MSKMLDNLNHAEHKRTTVKKARELSKEEPELYQGYEADEILQPLTGGTMRAKEVEPAVVVGVEDEDSTPVHEECTKQCSDETPSEEKPVQEADTHETVSEEAVHQADTIDEEPVAEDTETVPEHESVPDEQFVTARVDLVQEMTAQSEAAADSSDDMVDSFIAEVKRRNRERLQQQMESLEELDEDALRKKLIAQYVYEDGEGEQPSWFTPIAFFVRDKVFYVFLALLLIVFLQYLPVMFKGKKLSWDELFDSGFSRKVMQTRDTMQGSIDRARAYIYKKGSFVAALSYIVQKYQDENIKESRDE